MAGERDQETVELLNSIRKELESMILKEREARMVSVRLVFFKTHCVLRHGTGILICEFFALYFYFFPYFCLCLISISFF